MKKQKQKRRFTHYLAMWGSICTGLVYTGIGVIAVLSFLKIKQGGADEGSMLVYLYSFVVGKVLVWLILSGMIGFITWRMYETVHDPYGYGRNLGGILRRTAIALSSLADALIAYSAILAILGISGALETGQPTAERELTARVLEKSWGALLLVIIGILLIVIAFAQMVYVISRAYWERLDIHMLSRWKQTAIHILAWAGHFARGIILGIIGFFSIKAGITETARYVVNTDKAFDFIGDHIGHVYFILVAIGTICYGVFSFVLGVYYDSEKH